MSKEKVAIYCRLSKEDEEKINKGDDSESIQNQKLLLMDYAMAQGWSIHKVYSDDDRKGFDRDRPEFNRLIRDAELGLFNIVLCKHQSRFTRDMELAERYLHSEFLLWGVRFVSIVDHVDTNIKGTKKARQINGLINEWYSEDLSENIRTIFKNKMKAGQFLGSFAPYGYIKSPSNRHKLAIDDEAAEVVREIFNLYLQGHGSAQIANILTKKGVPTPSAYKKEKGLNFESPNCGKYSKSFGCWAYNSIKRILQNKVYIGYLIQGRERKMSYKSKKVVIAPKDEWIIIPNNHEPIIDEKTFHLVQELIERKRKVHRPVNGYKGSGSSHILAGKVFCLDCGTILHRGGTARDGKTHYLRCKLAYKTKSKECTPHSIKLDDVVRLTEDKIRGIINTYIANENNAALVIEEFNSKSNIRKSIELKEKEIKKCHSKLQETQGFLTAAYSDKVRGIISEENFISMKQIYDSDTEVYKNRMLRLEEDLKEMDLHYKSLHNIKRMIDKCTNFEMLTHEIVNDFIDNIQVGEKDERGEQVVIINWLF